MPDEAALSAFLDAPEVMGGTNAPPLTGKALQSGVQALREAKQSQVQPVDKNLVKSDAERMGARPGVPFDESTGIPLYNRLRADMQRNQEDQLTVLKHIYGNDGVRMNDKGNPVITVIAEDGKPRDILVNPEGPDKGDLMYLLANAPEMIVSGLVMKGIPVSKGILPALRAIGAMAISAEATGAGKDAAVRAGEGIQVDLGEIGKSRGEMALTDMVVGAGLGVLAKGASEIIGVQPKLNFEGEQARENLIRKFNLPVDALPYTPAQSSGQKILSKGESLLSKKPGASDKFDAINNRTRGDLEKVQRAIQGNTPPMMDEDLGRRAINELTDISQRFDKPIEVAQGRVISEAEREIRDNIAQATKINDTVDRSALGQSIRDSSEVKRAQFRAQNDKNYAEVYSDPKVQGKVISSSELAKDAEEIRSKLPTDISNEAVPTGLVDQFGGDLTQNVEKKTVLKEFVPPNVKDKLERLASLNGEFKLDELIQMRSDVSNDIAQGEAIPGYQTKYLSDIRAALTKRIKGGLEEVDPSGELLKKWQSANDSYAEGVTKFKQAGISELFRDPEQLSHLSNSDIVNRAIGDKGADDVFKAYKDFFGENHPAIGGIKRAVADNVLGVSELNPTVEAKGFLDRLESLFLKAPNMAREVFGDKAASLKSSALALKGATANLDKEELQRVMASGNLSADKLRELAAVQAKRDASYRNDILRAVRDGNVGEGDIIKPSEFVDKFAFATEPEQIKQVMKRVTPELAEDIRINTMAKVFKRAADKDGKLTSAGIEKILEDPTMKNRIGAVVGDETIQDLHNISRFLKPMESINKLFEAAGSFGQSGTIRKATEGGFIEYGKLWVNGLVMGALYSNPVTRSIISSRFATEETRMMAIQAAVASEPFIRNLIALAGPSTGEKVGREINESMSRAVLRLAAGRKKEAESKQPVISDQKLIDFLDGKAQ